MVMALKAKEGDKRAFGRLFRSSYKDIFDYVYRRIGNRADAEDITMQVFANGLAAIGSFEEKECSVKAWLFRIAHNLVVDYFRASREFVNIDEMPVVMAEEQRPDERLILDQEIQAVYKEVRRLPAAQAEVLILRFMNDLTIAETATILDKKEVTVRALQFKGIKRLRLRLAETTAEEEAES